MIDMFDKTKYKKKMSPKELLEAMDEFVKKGNGRPDLTKELQRSRREDWICACKGD
ncbi:MAG TPA: hypothetical protein VJH24_01750 [Candidatus Bilamarchaeaceae archaeon]|nr:hypothetical protein [Candidatus Bilamarchaeaceae archaeon]